MDKKIRVAILDDHQYTIDGYKFNLQDNPQIEVVATVNFGDELEAALKQHPADILLLDINVPTAVDNPNPYPILHTIPTLLQEYPDLHILVISMHVDRGLIRAVMKAGASGYILKDDQATAKKLASVVLSVARGDLYFSELAQERISTQKAGIEALTPRQSEALSICAAYPGIYTAELAKNLSVSNSTARNLLSMAYLKLGVSNLAGAIDKARQLGWITPYPPEPPT